MAFEKLTVKELRDIAAERGIDLKGSLRKADIIAALEAAQDKPVQAEVVEAEVIEDTPTGDLAITFTAGAISANFDALEAQVDGILAQYEGWEPSADDAGDVEQCKRERQYLNALAKKIDDGRKSTKQEFLRPLNAFEDRANSIRDKIRSTVERIKAVEDEAEESRRESKREELMEHYQAFAGLLADVVEYDTIADPKWLNKTVSIQKAKAELEEKVRAAASDWDTLKSLGLEFAEQAEIEFFKTLSLGQATAYAKKLADDKRRIDAMKAELDRPQAAAEPAPPVEDAVPAEAYEGFEVADLSGSAFAADVQQAAPVHNAVSAMPDDTASQIAEALRSYPRARQENMLSALRDAQKPDASEAVPCVMVIDAATARQMEAVGKVCGLFGVTGTFESGTLAEVCQRAFPGQYAFGQRRVFDYA